MKNKNEESPYLKQLGRKSLFFGLFLIVLFILVPLIFLRTRNNAVQNSVRLSTSVPLPPQSDIIYSNNGFIFNSIGCYHGYSVNFIGSNLDVSETIKTYREYFTSQGWHVH